MIIGGIVESAASELLMLTTYHTSTPSQPPIGPKMAVITLPAPSTVQARIIIRLNTDIKQGKTALQKTPHSAVMRRWRLIHGTRTMPMNRCGLLDLGSREIWQKARHARPNPPIPAWSGLVRKFRWRDANPPPCTISALTRGV